MKFQKLSAFIVAFAISPLAMAGSKGTSITEFSVDEKTEFGWEIVNDGVMGGLSKGKINRTDEGTLKFEGNLSLKNNGGFTTFRSKRVNFDLSDDEGLLMRVKGDGRTYQARLATDAKFRSWEASFTGEFDTVAGEWTEVKVPFSNFQAGFRGMKLKGLKMNPSKISKIGVLLGDKKEGPFKLEIDWIRTYGKDQGIQLTSRSITPPNLVDAVVADGRFKTLATALTKADLLKVLSGSDEFTVFAPTDEAFAKLPKSALNDLMKPENKSKLVATLTYHVIPGKAGLGDALKAAKVTTVQKGKLDVAFSKGAVRINKAKLIDSDIEVTNGMIHVIDSVLLPPKPDRKTLLSVAEGAGSFKTLLAAVKAAGLESLLEGDKPLTVFAPTDEAFASLPEGTIPRLLKKENRSRLKEVLSRHVVAGKVSAGDALNAGKTKALNGVTLDFGIDNGLFNVNGSVIRSAGIDGGNGIIHVVDTVIGFAESQGCQSSDCEVDPKVTEAPKASGEDATQLIISAIEKGVPLYNSGNVSGCVDVYRECLEELSENDRLDERARAMLSKVITSGQSHSENSRAWFYRKALDTMMSFLSR